MFLNQLNTRLEAETRWPGHYKSFEKNEQRKSFLSPFLSEDLRARDYALSLEYLRGTLATM